MQHIHIQLDGKGGDFSAPVLLEQVVKTLIPSPKNPILACLRGREMVELTDTLDKPCTLKSLSYFDEEGRRIYERSLRFVFLLAVKRLYPQTRIRIEHSIGQGVFIIAENRRLSAYDVSNLEKEMREIVNEDLPFKQERWSKARAIEHFRSSGEDTTARLLGDRPFDYFPIYGCDGHFEYFYGAMLPSTGFLKVFSLRAYTPGLVLLLPCKEDPSRPADYLPLPKHMAAFAQSNYWCKVLECTDAADLNDLIRQNKLRDFIRVNEALHDKSLADIAEDLVNRASRLIFIAGPSSSGKTTFANRLAIHLRVEGLKPVILSMDDFYRNRRELPLEADGKPDLEALDALDLPCFEQCLTDLIEGREAALPRFDFSKQSRSEHSKRLKISSDQPLIIEGIHGLNPRLYEAFDPKLYSRIFISELTTLNLDNHNRIRTTDARLLRRIVRDYLFRATSPSETLEIWDSVRRGEEKWIFPYQELADFVFNSALHYELPVLKHISYNILKQVPKDSPDYIKCNRILKILHYLLPIEDSILKEIPPLSILREFIGGNTLYEP